MEAIEMGHKIYLSLNGKTQGLVSAGCSSFDSIGNSYQNGHADQMLIQELHHSLTREQHVSHHPIIIKKPIDKSSPLLAAGISNNEEFDGVFEFYRTDASGAQVVFFIIKITKATIFDISVSFPDSLNHNDAQPFETVSFKYQSITWTHVTAGTSGYCIWDEMVY